MSVGGHRLAVSAALTIATLVGFASSIPVQAAQGTWTDTFTSANQVLSSARVAIANGEVRLSPARLERQGFAFGTGQDVTSPSIVRMGSEYYLYYATGGLGSISIGVATSPDASSWTDHGLVITPGFQGASDSLNVLYEDVIAVGSTFNMYYSGQDGGTGLYSILHAVSADGLNWTGAGTALSPENVQGSLQSAYAPSVIWSGSAYTMWYTTYDGSNTWIRLATSADGISWIREGIVLAPLAPDDASGPRMPTVVQSSSDFVMWYSCSGAIERFCRARSADGRSWEREGPVLSPDPSVPGESSRVALVSALETAQNSYRVWYAALGSGVWAIYTALATVGYDTPGYLTSVSIYLPSNQSWLWLQVDQVEPSGTSIRVAVLDPETGVPFSGYVVVSGTNVSLAGIDSRSHPAIRLNATLISGPDATPQLEAWSVGYGTPAASPSTPSGFQIPIELFAALAVAGGVLIGGGGYWTYLRIRRGPRIPR